MLLTILATAIAPAAHNTYSEPEIGVDELAEVTSSVVHPLVCNLLHPSFSKFVNFAFACRYYDQPERGDSTRKQNQCIFIRGFRISIRQGIFAAAFRGPLAISSVSESTPENIFGSQSGSTPFPPQTKRTRSLFGGWFGRGATMRMSRPASNRQASAPERCGEQQTHVQDILLNPILTTSEVIHVIRNCTHPLTLSSQLHHPFKTIQRYLLDSVGP
jgi:hypothetical protein